jgi:hypothetical protein
MFHDLGRYYSYLGVGPKLLPTKNRDNTKVRSSFPCFLLQPRLASSLSTEFSNWGFIGNLVEQ